MERPPHLSFKGTYICLLSSWNKIIVYQKGIDQWRISFWRKNLLASADQKVFFFLNGLILIYFWRAEEITVGIFLSSYIHKTEKKREKIPESHNSFLLHLLDYNIPLRKLATERKGGEKDSWITSHAPFSRWIINLPSPSVLFADLKILNLPSISVIPLD